MLQGLKHVAYAVADLAEAKEWYRRLLGTEPTVDSPVGVVFRVGESGLSLVPGVPASAAAGAMVYWAVDDVDRVHETLLRLGATSRMEANTVFGIRRAAVSDPFGNTIGIIGQLASARGGAARSIEHRPSDTAQGVAALRALAVTDAREEIRGRDVLAELFLTEDQKRPLRDPVVRDWVMKHKVPPGLYEFLLCRTAYFDRIVEQSLSENIPQLVFLGAGYDTRPYRFHALAATTKIFELDALPTQNRKVEILRRHNIQVPGGLVFVPIDLHRDSLGGVLRNSGFDWSLKTLFVLEGLLYYLTPEAVDRTLASIRQEAACDSRLCLDLKCRLSADADAQTRDRMREMAEAHRQGEPILFEIDPERVAPFLSERGFRVEEDLTADEMAKRFLALRDGSLAGKVPGVFRIIGASIISSTA